MEEEVGKFAVSTTSDETFVYITIIDTTDGGIFRQFRCYKAGIDDN